MLSNPLFNKIAKLFGLPEQIFSFRFRGGVREVIIDLVPLPAAGIEI